MISAKNHAELLFEDYLRSLPIDFAYEPEVVGRSKRPDYRVEIHGKRYWFEVIGEYWFQYSSSGGMVVADLSAS